MPRESRTRSCAAAAAIVLALTAGSFAGAARQLASRPVSEWIKVLDAPERLAGLKIDEVVARLGLEPGDVVADLGAGSGPFVAPFARTVGPKGKVYAVEIDREYFPFIEDKAKKAGVTNVRTVLGEFSDPKLPASDVDVAFLHDVLHHIDNRAAYLKSLLGYLKPDGRIVVIDYHPERSPHRDDPKLQVSRAQASAWLAEAGFRPVNDVPLFEDKWFVIYRR
jgi:ubiquinone/menaquinone biosynthesis C-methylase UbiE